MENFPGTPWKKLKVGARLEEHPDKKHPWDFALWLSAPKEHLMKWDSPWGTGYPGWHIECSAMSIEYLGETIDIHTGGEDNIFPHHEAEIAQSQCANDKKFVNFWIHGRHLLVDGEKMSKSKGNFYKLEDVKEKGFTPVELRLLMLSSNHQSQLNFTWKAMEQSRSNLGRITDFIGNLKNIPEGGVNINIELEKYAKKFEAAMDDDLNVSLAMSVVYEMITSINKLLAEEKIGAQDAKNILAFWEKINKVLGLEVKEKSVKIPEEIKELTEERKVARKERDFDKADKIRKKIEKKGYSVEDTKDGQKIKKTS